MIQESTILQIFKGSERAPLLVPYWVQYLPSSEINTPLRLAAYFAQIAQETGNLRSVEENLNYSAKGLAEIWPKRYAINPDAKVKEPNSLALALHRKPELIANTTYANRMGNGDILSGDGFKYRGRGLFQLTGKDNYAAYSRDTYNDNRCVINPSLVAYAEDSVRSSIWFWEKKNLSVYADQKDIKGMTRVINGGYTHLDQRIAHFNKYCNLLLA